MNLREEIVAEAHSWRGTPWRHRSMVKGLGVDCAHFVIGVMQGVGLPAGTEQVYPRDWHLHRSEERFLEDVLRYCDEIEGWELEPGDLVMVKIGRCFSHGALFIGGDNAETVIHSVRGHGVIFSYLSDTGIGDRKRRYFRHKGLVHA